MRGVGARLRRAGGWPATATLAPLSRAVGGGTLEPDMQRSAENLLKTYLGERTGERVLAGHTNRGEGEKIHAVICATCGIRPGFPKQSPWKISFAP